MAISYPISDLELDGGEPDVRFPRLPLVVTGMARSGTMYVSKLLTEGGLFCGHEKIFCTFGRIDFSDLQADSSCFAVPHLGRLHPHTPVVHLVRNPYAWLKSWQRKRISNGYLDKHLSFNYSWWWQSSQAGAAMQAWIEWNLNCERYAWQRIKLEELDADRLLQLCKLGGIHTSLERCLAAVATVPRDVNSMRTQMAVDLEFPDSKVTERFMELATRYGYSA